MGRFCNICRRIFGTERGYSDHMIDVHRYPKPPRPLTGKFYHPTFTGKYYNSDI